VNTAKQVNIMIGLLMIGMLGTLLYYMFDNGDSVLGFNIGDRQTVAADRQELDNAERGGALFARYCRACHGLTGMGSLERTGLPGAVLNAPTNRPPGLAAAAVTARQLRLTDTIHCGRVGTVMPPWSTAEGGGLNDFQIFQLVTLITSKFSPQAWDAAVADGNTTDSYKPAKFLARDVAVTDTTIVVTSTDSLTKGDFVRIGADTIDEPYEIMQVVDFDANTNIVTVARGPKVPWTADPGSATIGSDAIAHKSGNQIYVAPVSPGTSITGDPASPGDAPCGQRKAPATPSASVVPVALTDGATVTLGDNFFQMNNEQNPPFTAAAGQATNLTLHSTGSNVHNLHIDGPDGKFDTADDPASVPDPIAAGTTATISINLPAGTYNYRCDFHPTEMKGTIVVQ
jgi:plastocyanin/mono/diheme cytochrome c family protein